MRLPPALALAFLAAAASAQAPSTIAYQGVLEDDAVPVTTATSMTFRLYDAASGGTEVWTETRSVTPGAGGAFAVRLGEVAALSSVAFDDQMWVEVSVEGTTLGPRTALQAVPYARSLTPGAVVRGNVFPEGSPASGAALYVENESTAGRGVYGVVTAEFGSPEGVYGLASASSGLNYGVYGESASTSGRGLGGVSVAPNGTTYGVYGVSYSTSGHAVFGAAIAPSGTTYGVYGRVTSPTGYAGYFTGGRGLRVDESGTPSGSGTGYVHVRYASGGSRPHLLLDDTNAGGFARLRMANANAADAYWDLAAGGSGGDAFNVFYWDGTSGSNLVGVNAPGAGLPLIATASGASLTQGGVWANASSRALKTDFLAVDPEAVLTTLASVPVTRWRYHTEADDVWHLGPMSQDFHGAFGLGSTDEAIGTVDADGVALASIQALHARTEAQADELAAQAARIAALEAERDRLAEAVAALAARLDALPSPAP